MTFFWWTIIFILFVLSFIGVILPILPGLPFLWAAFLIYHFFIHSIFSNNFWITMVIISLFIIAADFLLSSHWVKRWGGSKAGSWGAIIGLIIGPFILGPIGIIIAPFILVVVIEVARGIHAEKALKMGLASLIGLVGSSIAKIILQIIMIIIFVFYR